MKYQMADYGDGARKCYGCGHRVDDPYFGYPHEDSETKQPYHRDCFYQIGNPEYVSYGDWHSGEYHARRLSAGKGGQ